MAEEQIAFKCRSCGAELEFAPGTTSLKCRYCGAENTIDGTHETIVEIDYREFIEKHLQEEQKIEIAAVKCTSCGASTTFPPNVSSGACPFCGSNIVLQHGTTSSVLRPKSLLPFQVTLDQAHQHFRQWVNHLWFAPFGFKKQSKTLDRFAGVYIPYWTYDAATTSSYTGARGEYYYTTESYTTQEGGRTVNKTRQVRHTRWYPVSGVVDKNFDDVLVLASRSLPPRYTTRLEPWDLANLVPFTESYLSGFRTESYQIDVTTGFESAKEVMDQHIRSAIRQRIGGDEQRIHSVSTRHDNITFKHILLPVWINAYRYNNKVFRFLINGRSGEVQGERPYSWVKIALLVVSILAVIALVVVLTQD